MKRPYLPLFTRDWLDDLVLRKCSPASRAVLVDLMCLMQNGEPYGHLTDESGSPLQEKMILSRLYISTSKYRALVQELEKEKRLHRTDTGTLYCRRMVKDEETRLKRSVGGALGGNPSLKVNHEGKPEGYHGPSHVRSRAETETGFAVLSKKTSLLDDFGIYQEAAAAAQLEGSESDWTDAGFVWGQLDFEAKALAVKGLRERTASGDYNDPAYRPLVHNYLKKKMWQRPIRASPVNSSERRLEEMLKKSREMGI